MHLRISDDGESYVDETGERYTRVSRVLNVCGLVRGWYGGNNSGRDRGSAVHLACDLINKALLQRPETDPATVLDPNTVDERIRPYVGGYLEFLRASGFNPSASECMLASVHGFAGTIDSVGPLNGRLVIVDIKTGESIDPAFDYQTGAYEILWNENFPNQLIQARFALQLKANGKYKLHPATRPASEFLDQWDKYLSKTQTST